MDTIATLDQALGRAAKLLRVLREAGLPEEVLQTPIDDPNMRKRLVRFWLSGGCEHTTSQKVARQIMGRNFFNFFGVEEAVTHFGVKPSTYQTVPFTQATLEQCKETHVLVAVFPLSIVEICAKVSQHRLFSNLKWYGQHAFANEKGEIEWKLIRKKAIERSINKTWPEQQALLAGNEETPTARVMVYTIIGHFLATGKRLFEKTSVRCSDVDSNSGHIGVGCFDSDGLELGDLWDNDRLDLVGLSSARKSD
jgi:hypothetical protein